MGAKKQRETRRTTGTSTTRKVSTVKKSAAAKHQRYSKGAVMRHVSCQAGKPCEGCVRGGGGGGGGGREPSTRDGVGSEERGHSQGRPRWAGPQEQRGNARGAPSTGSCTWSG